MAPRPPPREPRTEPNSRGRSTKTQATADGSLPRSRPIYRTGNSYPGGEDKGSGGEPVHSMGRDIYGENDPLPDDEEGQEGTDLGGGAAPEPDGTKAGPPCRLVVVGGPDRGKIRRFVGVRMVVGRTPGCSILLKDTAVSRRHLELVLSGQGVLLRDLGSGNGTRVNGQPFTEGLLKHLDMIEIGQSKLQFVDEIEQRKRALEEEKRNQQDDEKKQQEQAHKIQDEVKVAEAARLKTPQANAAEQNQKLPAGPELTRLSAARAELSKAWRRLDGSRKVALAALGIAAAGLLFVAVPLMLRPQPPPSPPLHEVMAKKKLDSAQAALSEGRYSDALELLDSAERLSPGPDKVGLKERIRAEVSAHRGLENARALLRQHKFDEAWTTLGEVLEASPQILREKKALESELDRRQSEFMENNADQALNRLDIDAAKELIGHLPEERQSFFAPKLAQAQAKLEEQQKLQKQQAALEKENERQRQQAIQETRMEATFRGVEHKFQAQEFDRATLECDRVIDSATDGAVRDRALALKRLIPQFYRNWMDGQSKLKVGAMEGARQSLRKAKELYDDIHLQGILGPELEEQLLQATLASGKAALARNDLASAALLFNDASRQNPRDPNAQEGLARISRRLDELYLEAYMNRDRDPQAALAKFKIIVEAAPKNSPAYRKAKHQLRSFGL